MSPKPKPVKPKPTEAQVRACEAERDAVKAKRDDRQSQIWHEKNCCKICGSASHWWWQCEVQYCVYCHSSEHCKYSRIDFESITCPELIEKNKRLDKSDRKWSAAQAKRCSRDHLKYHIQWCDELSRKYYGDMHRRNDRRWSAPGQKRLLGWQRDAIPKGLFKGTLRLYGTIILSTTQLPSTALFGAGSQDLLTQRAWSLKL